MLHPVDIVSVGVILSSVSSSGLLSSGGGGDGLDGVLHNVSKLKSLDEIRVPDHASVLDSNLVVLVVDLVHLLDSVVQRLLGPEDGGIGLHGLLHLQTDVGGGERSSRVPDPIEVLDRLVSEVLREDLVRLSRLEGLGDVVSASSSEDDDIEKGVGSESVGSVNGNTGSLSSGVESRNDDVVSVLVDGDGLSGPLGRDTSHVVVDGRKNGDGLLGHVDSREDGSGLRDSGKSLGEDGGGEMRELKVDVILEGSNSSSLPDLDGHGPRDNISRREILGGRGVSLHESLSFRVEEVSSLSSRPLSDEASSTVDSSRVELNEFEILKGKTSSDDHGVSVSRAGVSRSAGEVSPTVTSSSENGLVRPESVKGSILHVQGENSDTLALGGHEEIKSEVLDEEVGVVLERLSVEGVQHGVSSSIGSGGTSVSLSSLSEVQTLSSESSLVDLSFRCTREGKSEVLQLENRLGSFSTHVVDGVLISEPI